jgi:chromate reductase
MTTYNIGVLVGSLRKQSLNRKMAHALKGLAPAALKLEIVEIGQLPHCNADDEANPPQTGKPTAVISVSPGALGAFGANHQLRQSFVFLDMPAMQQPEAYIGGAVALFDDKGELTNASTREFATKYLESFARWVERHTAKAAA